MPCIERFRSGKRGRLEVLCNSAVLGLEPDPILHSDRQARAKLKAGKKRAGLKPGKDTSAEKRHILQTETEPQGPVLRESVPLPHQLLIKSSTSIPPEKGTANRERSASGRSYLTSRGSD